MAAIYRNVPVLDTGARGATVTFAQRGLGDVLIAWENEAFLTLKEFGADKFEIVVPSVSILAEPPVALVDGNVDAKGTRKVAEAYLNSSIRRRPGHHRQELPAVKPEAPPRTTSPACPTSKLFTIDQAFGGWARRRRSISATAAS